MKIKENHKTHRLIALILAVVMVLSLAPAAFAAQSSEYHDPAEEWLTANNRTNELDANAVVTHETATCGECQQKTSFLIFRVPEYTKTGETALNRNVLYSDGTCIDGESKGNVNDGTPGVNAYYTGYHWTKSVCETCGTINSNGSGYSYGLNVYQLYDCAAEFFHDLDTAVSYEQTDSTYHTKITKSGEYCSFCFGTYKETKSALERHNLSRKVVSQLANQRFVVTDTCGDCGYEKTAYVGAKSVITNYYGYADGAPHTLIVSDLSEVGVSTAIRYGYTAGSCTLTSAPNYVEAGYYTVYYEITYSYGGVSMTESGVAYVWLLDTESGNNGDCTGKSHNYVYHDKVSATCLTLGYDRYLCMNCGNISKQNYTAALGHLYHSVVIRDATCEAEGKIMEICSRCGDVKVTATSKGEHEYETVKIAATCTSPGYTLKECAVCGDRHITNITDALAHSYVSHVTAATCTTGGHTTHICNGCGSSFITDYTAAAGHTWNSGTAITNSSCVGDGVTEYKCRDCSEKKLVANSATGHKPGEKATCTDAQICLDCGAILAVPTGHDIKVIVTTPTCTEGGYTTYKCANCDISYTNERTDALGHDWDAGTAITVHTCDSEGVTQHECNRCGEKKLVAKSAKGHTPGAEADCTQPQLCFDCGAILAVAKGHSYKTTVTAATCEGMGFTTYFCDCGHSYASDYTAPTGHKPGGWIVDKEPTTGSEGSRHKECADCGKTTDSETLDKLKNEDTTDKSGVAIVGKYKVIVTDTQTTNPVSNATVKLKKDGGISITLPNSRLLDYEKQTTVSVYLIDYTSEDVSPVESLFVELTDRYDNYASGLTDKNGKITVPTGSGVTNSDGNITVGYENADGDYYTLKVKVERYETGRPIPGAKVSITKTGKITVVLPDGVDMDENNRIVVTVTDNKNTAQPDMTVTVKGDLGQSETEQTDKKGQVVVPPVPVEEIHHGAYIYGYPDGTVRPNGNMTRSEAAAVFARLLAEYKGETIRSSAYSAFPDVKTSEWYAGYVSYLKSYSIIAGYADGTFGGGSEITRAEFVAMAVRFYEALNGVTVTNGANSNVFTDVYNSYWAITYINAAASNDWINGYPDGTFGGDKAVTRAEVVAIVNRLLGRVADEDYINANLSKLNTFPDLTTPYYWAYYDLMEAANGHTLADEDGKVWCNHN